MRFLFFINLSLYRIQDIIYSYWLYWSLEIGEFQKIVGGFIDMVDALAKEVEKEKMKVNVQFKILK